MRKGILLLLLVIMFCSGCKVKDFTNIKPLTDFSVLKNGNVEIVWVEDDGRFRTLIVENDNFYPYEGESKVVETVSDGYFRRFIYLSEEDYARFTSEVKEKAWQEN